MSDLYELPNGWEWKTIDEFTTIKSGKRVPKGKKLLDDTTPYPYIRVTDFSDNGTVDTSDIKFISEEIYQQIKNYTITDNDIYISVAGTIGKTGIIPSELNGANLTENAVKIVFDNTKYDKNFIFNFTNSNTFMEQIGLATKTVAMPKLAIKRLKEVQIPLPPLSEQQRIVSKLDLLFEKIDRAIALHVSNMKEADAFMASVLNDVFGELEEKYGLKEINSLFKIKSGNFLPAKNMIEDGEINVYGGNGINGKHNVFNLSGENIIIGRVGALCGNVRCINDNIWLTDNAFYISEYFEDIDKKFLTQMLIHINLGSSANQSAQPVISYKSISELKLPLPPLQTQQKVVSYLDEISQKIQILKQVQKEKMDSLKALKASILDSAFRGEL